MMRYGIRKDFYDDDIASFKKKNSTDYGEGLESFLSDYLEKNLEKMMINYLKGIDITFIIQNILAINQEQVLGQLLKSLRGEFSNNIIHEDMGNSLGQTMNYLINSVQRAFTKYL